MPDRLGAVYDDVEAKAPAILAAGTVPPPPVGPLELGAGYALACDVAGDLGAVTFAVVDMYPDLADGMWCLAMIYRRLDDVWVEFGEHDSTTTARPFERIAAVENSTLPWIDWHSNGPLMPHETGCLHSYFGVAPVTTTRLTVSAGGGAERDLRITRGNGAYVAVVSGRSSTLSGYGADGRLLGQFDAGQADSI